jgi:peptidyl-tRNA hydrolase
MCGQVKVVVKIESEDDMLELQVYFYLSSITLLSECLPCEPSNF